MTSPDAKVVTFCRNPYDRFISGYVNKILNPPPLERTFFKWIRREILFERARLARDGHEIEWIDHFSLRDFARFVAAQHPAQRDRHWADQRHLTLVEAFTPARIIKLEDLDRGLSLVWLDLIGREFPDTSNFVRNSSRRAERVLDEETAEIIYMIYQRDFEIFGYERGSWSEF